MIRTEGVRICTVLEYVALEDSEGEVVVTKRIAVGETRSMESRVGICRRSIFYCWSVSLS